MNHRIPDPLLRHAAAAIGERLDLDVESNITVTESTGSHDGVARPVLA